MATITRDDDRVQSPAENQPIIHSKFSGDAESYISFPRTPRVARQEGWDSLLELEPWICTPGDLPPPSTPVGLLEMEKTPSSSSGSKTTCQESESSKRSKGSSQGSTGSSERKGSRQGSAVSRGSNGSRQESAMSRGIISSYQEAILNRASKESLQVSSSSQESNGSRQGSSLSAKENKSTCRGSISNNGSQSGSLSTSTRERKIKVTVVSGGTPQQQEVLSPRNHANSNLGNKVPRIQRKSPFKTWMAQRKSKKSIPESPAVDSRVNRILAEGTVAPRIKKHSKILSEADRLYDLIEKAAEHHRNKARETDEQASMANLSNGVTSEAKSVGKFKKNKDEASKKTTSSKTSSTREEPEKASNNSAKNLSEDELQQVREIILSIRQARGDPDMPLSEIRKRLQEFSERDVRRLFHPSDSRSKASSKDVTQSTASNSRSESSQSTLTGEAQVEEEGEEEMISVAYVTAAPSLATDGCNIALPGYPKCIRPCECNSERIERFGPLSPLEKLGALFFGGAEDADNGDAESRFRRIVSDITSYTFSASSTDHSEHSDNSILQKKANKKGKSKDFLDLLGGNPSELASTDVSNAGSRPSTEAP